MDLQSNLGVVGNVRTCPEKESVLQILKISSRRIKPANLVVMDSHTAVLHNDTTGESQLEFIGWKLQKYQPPMHKIVK